MSSETSESGSSPASTQKHWFVLRVQSGREDQVKESLERRIKLKGLQDRVTKVEVPTERISEIRRGKRMERVRKLYPGYLMIEVELDPESGQIDDDVWFTVRETPGIGDFLGLRKPVPMRAHEVEKMLRTSSESAEKPKLDIQFERGDSVRIKEGPFENFDGVVEEVVQATGKVVVSVTIFGRATKVDLEYWQIEKI